MLSVRLNACMPALLQHHVGLTGTYDHLTKWLIKVIHPLIRGTKPKTDPHIFIHLGYIWSLKQSANDNKWGKVARLQGCRITPQSYSNASWTEWVLPCVRRSGSREDEEQRDKRRTRGEPWNKEENEDKDGSSRRELAAFLRAEKVSASMVNCYSAAAEEQAWTHNTFLRTA